MARTGRPRSVKPGDRFRRLTLVCRDHSDAYGHPVYLFVCDCGNNVISTLGNVKQGRTHSCGCLKSENGKRHAEEYFVSHGETRGRVRSPEYGSWQAMIARCENSKNVAFHYYGGRGIKVCVLWRNSYEAFLADMGRRPSAQHTLDRIDTNGDYCPENCRWADWKTQMANRRCMKRATGGESHA